MVCNRDLLPDWGDRSSTKSWSLPLVGRYLYRVRWLRCRRGSDRSLVAAMVAPRLEGCMPFGHGASACPLCAKAKPRNLAADPVALSFYPVEPRVSSSGRFSDLAPPEAGLGQAFTPGLWNHRNFSFFEPVSTGFVRCALKPVKTGWQKRGRTL